MKKILITAVAVIVFATIGIGMYQTNFRSGTPVAENRGVTDIKNVSAVIGGETFVLVKGLAEKESAPGSADKNILRMFGEPAYGDLDDDGDEDAAILFENNRGGSGMFYYAALIINNDGFYKTTNAIFLGDRIAPQTMYIMDDRAVFNFVERLPGEPMTTRPSWGKSVWINYDKSTGEISGADK